MILLIYADNCRDCERMKSFIDIAIKEQGKDIDVKIINSDTDEAIDVAIENGIEDIPGCVIGECVMYGKKGFNYELIYNAIREI